MQVQGVETRDGDIYEEYGHCHICGSQPQRVFVEQLALRDDVPGPWMVRITHASATITDHFLPAETIANIRVR